MKKFRYAAVLLFAVSLAAEANVHGVDSVRVVPHGAPPAYDFDQITAEVSDTISRTERNLKVQVEVLKLGVTSGSNDCGFMFGFETLCYAANAVERAVDRAQTRDTIQALKDKHVESDPTLGPDLADNVDKLLASNWLQVRLARAVRDVVADQTMIDVAFGTEELDANYHLNTRLISVKAVGRSSDSGVAIRLAGQVNLIDTRSGTLLDNYDYSVQTPPHYVEGWAQGGVTLLADAIDAAIESMAQVLAEEVLLTVTSPQLRGKGYLVDVVTPKNKTCVFSCKFMGMGSKGYFATESLQPEFSWRDFREAYADDPLYADVATSNIDVSYDFKIFRAKFLHGTLTPPIGEPAQGPPLLTSGKQVYEARAIAGTTFKPPVTLADCTPYTWTVRARFVANGNTHLTQWGGNYKEKQVEEYRQKRVSETSGARASRSIGGFFGFEQDDLLVEDVYYYPFLATSSGRKCKEQDIKAAIAQPARNLLD